MANCYADPLSIHGSLLSLNRVTRKSSRLTNYLYFDLLKTQFKLSYTWNQAKLEPNMELVSANDPRLRYSMKLEYLHPTTSIN